MLNILTLATKPEFVQEAFKLTSLPKYDLYYQGRIGDHFPILIYREGKVEMVNAMWGVFQPDYGLSFATTFPIGRTLKAGHPHTHYIRKNRCAVPVNLFFGKKKNQPYAIRILSERMFCLGGFYVHEEGKDSYSFCLYTTDPADILKSYLTDMPVLFRSDVFKRWISKTNLINIMSLADKAEKNWFDLFRVDPVIISGKQTNEKELLKPIGRTLSEYKAYRNSLKFKEDQLRMSRGK